MPKFSSSEILLIQEFFNEFINGNQEALKEIFKEMESKPDEKYEIITSEVMDEFVKEAEKRTEVNKEKKKNAFKAENPEDLCKGETRTRDENGKFKPCGLKKGYQGSDYCHHHIPNKPIKETKEKGEKTKCEAKTIKGTECSFPAKIDGLCTRHYNLKQKPAKPSKKSSVVEASD